MLDPSYSDQVALLPLLPTPRTRQSTANGCVAKANPAAPATPNKRGVKGSKIGPTSSAPSYQTLGVESNPLSSPTTSSSGKNKNDSKGTASSLGTPTGSGNSRLAKAKYGLCPMCQTGRRVRSRFKPHGTSPHAGKFRFLCSNNPRCKYWEVLDEDPINKDPALWQEQALRQAQLHAQTQQAQQAQQQKSGEALGGRGKKCPACVTGWLVEKLKDTFHGKQTVLVCGGGCGYQLEVTGDAGGQREIETLTTTNDTANCETRNGLTTQKKEKQHEGDPYNYGWDRSMEETFQGAEMVRPGNKRKIVVDLTQEDDEPPHKRVEHDILIMGERCLVGPEAQADLTLSSLSRQRAMRSRTTEATLLRKEQGGTAKKEEDVGCLASLKEHETASKEGVTSHKEEKNINKDSVVPCTQQASVVQDKKTEDGFGDFDSEEEKELLKLADQVPDEFNDMDDQEFLALADQLSNSLPTERRLF